MSLVVAKFTSEPASAFAQGTGPPYHAGLEQPLCIVDLRYTELDAGLKPPLGRLPCPEMLTPDST